MIQTRSSLAADRIIFFIIFFFINLVRTVEWVAGVRESAKPGLLRDITDPPPDHIARARFTGKF